MPDRINTWDRSKDITLDKLAAARDKILRERVENFDLNKNYQDHNYFNPSLEEVYAQAELDANPWPDGR